MAQQQKMPTKEMPAKTRNGKQAPAAKGRFYCALRQTPPRVLPPGVVSERAQLINMLSNKWVNGTVLHYFFFDREDKDGENVIFTDGKKQWQTWVGAEAQKDVVRRGFQKWADLAIGVKFEEVKERQEAEVRIGFMDGDGAWSWLGREILQHGLNERTMNFGWDLTGPGEIDTAIHEIGHTLGFPHEHQNPKAGIEWDEEAVYAALAAPPNNWSRETTFWNIIRKLPTNEVQGTTWDPNSIMHYPFEKGLIKKPEEFANKGLHPKGGLSERDITWAKTLYPPLGPKADDELKPAQSVLLNIAAGEQRNFTVMPKETRNYQFKTFGDSDSVLVLFEEDKGKLRYRAGDDDSGEGRNAYFKVRLTKGRKYVLRIRLYYADRPGETSAMMW